MKEATPTRDSGKRSALTVGCKMWQPIIPLADTDRTTSTLSQPLAGKPQTVPSISENERLAATASPEEKAGHQEPAPG